MTDLLWLHVPLETTRGDRLAPPTDGRMTVLDRPARLRERDLPAWDAHTDFGSAVIRQWLLFDPIPEAEAVELLDDLRARLPVLALRRRLALRVPALPLRRVPPEHGNLYNGPWPTLIPGDLTPTPMWVDLGERTSVDARGVLGGELDACPAVRDERVAAAIDLATAARYDALPRSVFLSHMTILDALAARAERPENVRAWLDKVMKEAKALNDQGLNSGLAGLKRGSHGSAVRDLIGHAAWALGRTDAEADELSHRGGEFFRVQSGLSHAGGAAPASEDVEDACRLAGLVIEAVVEHPRLLETRPAPCGEHRTAFRNRACTGG